MQEYTAIKIWDKLNNRYAVWKNKSEWTKASYAKNAALNMIHEESRKTLHPTPGHGLSFKDQTRFEVHRTKVIFEKIEVL